VKTLYVRVARAYRIAHDDLELMADFIVDDLDQQRYAVHRTGVTKDNIAGETMTMLRDLAIVWDNLDRPRTKLLHLPKGAIGDTFAMTFGPHLTGVEKCPE
jgi:hypothetical protein